jgi:hypothetical protein
MQIRTPKTVRRLLVLTITYKFVSTSLTKELVTQCWTIRLASADPQTSQHAVAQGFLRSPLTCAKCSKCALETALLNEVD